MHIGNLAGQKNRLGLLKCKALPPYELYLPVLPASLNEKLTFFFVIRTNGTNLSSGECTHTIDQIALTGILKMDVIQTAV